MKKASLFTGIALAVLGSAYLFIGYRYTIYSVGLYLIPFVIVLAAVIAFVATLAFKRWKSSWWPIFNGFAAAMFAVLIAIIAVDNYKPTFTIYLPEGFEGMVHLLPAKAASNELYIDKNGIGYFNPGGDVDLKILLGSEDISDAMNQYGRASLIFPLADSLHYKAIAITCFEVVAGKVYGSSPWNQHHAKCMDETEFLAKVAQGIIDSTRVEQSTYPTYKD